MSFMPDIETYIQKEIEVLQALVLSEIESVLCLLYEAYERGSIVYVAGNGGSASTASHMCCDFNKGVSENLNKKFNFISLTDNIPMVLAIANDIGYEELFLFQLKNKLKPGDIVIGISGSGNSKNILKAVEYANEMGNVTVGITGYDGGILRRIAKYSINANVNDMQISEDVHIIVNHLMMRAMCRRLSNKADRASCKESVR